MYYDANINTNLEKTNLFYWQRICSDFYYNYTKNKQTRIMKKTIYYKFDLTFLNII